MPDGKDRPPPLLVASIFEIAGAAACGALFGCATPAYWPTHAKDDVAEKQLDIRGESHSFATSGMTGVLGSPVCIYVGTICSVGNKMLACI